MEITKIVQETTEDLLRNLLVEGQVRVEKKKEVYQVQIETKDTGLLIGYHGETISSLQLIISLIVYKKIGEWVKILVNVGDWRQKKEEALRQLAFSSVQKVIDNGQSVILSSLTAFERRIIHLTLADHPQVETVSQGEGKERKLIIKLKAEKTG